MPSPSPFPTIPPSFSDLPNPSQPTNPVAFHIPELHQAIPHATCHADPDALVGTPLRTPMYEVILGESVTRATDTFAMVYAGTHSSSQFYTHGEICDGFARRTFQINLRCGSTGRIKSVAESLPCLYIAEIELSLCCESSSGGTVVVPIVAGALLIILLFATCRSKS